MADFLDVPAFDGPGVFARASDSAWLAHAQTPAEAAEQKRKKRAAKAAAGDADGGVDAATGKKRKLHAGDGRAGERGTEAAGRGGARGEGGRGRAEKGELREGGGATAGKPAKSKQPQEPQRVSGKDLGRKRRAQAKREREREARRAAAIAREGGAAPPARPAAPRPAPAAAAKRAKAPASAPALSAEEEARAAKKAALQAKRALQRAAGTGGGDADASVAAPPVAAAPAPLKAKGTGKAEKPSLLARAQAQLAGGRFRWLNEALYTRSGDAALQLLSSEPALFTEYHQGFRKQTAAWPRQPLDECLAWLRRCPATWAVADFGCGDARLAAAAPQRTVHSFDLVAAAPGVVACDMCAVPLADESVQAAVFCLSLMGTDYGKALAEAARVLTPRGALWIAEVRSRFEGAGAGGGGVDAFLAALSQLGFTLRHRDESDTMFAVFRFVLERRVQPPPKLRWPPLKACEYKRR